ncbi:FecR domain-containing protein [Chitinophaga sp.]|uniref:FecR family protein n=1 Tax=Chitinophaga sp. TaxID=1869181 RepID=UPI0031DE8399
MDHQLLEKYLKGEASPEECKEVEAWLENAPEDWVDAFMEAHEQGGEPLPAPEKEAFTARVMQRVKPRRNRWMQVAAVMAGLLAAGWYLVKPGKVKVPALEMVDISIPANKTGKITLPDGSKVVMNAGSTLRYIKNFEGSTRAVTLTGEAFFDVSPDTEKPFIIQAGALSTRVLGTSLNISAYPGARRQTVTVLSGKVSVTDTLSSRAVTLLPKQQAVFLPASASLAAETVAHPENEIAWQQGRMVFDETPLSEVAEKLSRRYDVHIVLTNGRLANCRFNGQFEKEPLDVILKMITTLTSTRAKREGDTVYLSGKGCAPAN